MAAEPTLCIENMCGTCKHVRHMSKMIQIRNVPDDLHAQVKQRAAELHMTMSDYLILELNSVVGKPTWAELTAEIELEEPTNFDIEAMIRDLHREREERGG